MFRFLYLMTFLALASPAVAETLQKDGAPPTHPGRQTWQQHFGQANLAHDGRLTSEEAKGGFGLIAKHFDDIDVEHKGYVTENDVRAWRIMRKAAHRLSKPPEDKLRPRAAFQRVGPDGRTNASVRQTMAVVRGRPAANN